MTDGVRKSEPDFRKLHYAACSCGERYMRDGCVSESTGPFLRMQTLGILEGAAVAACPSQSSLFIEGKYFPHVESKK